MWLKEEARGVLFDYMQATQVPAGETTSVTDVDNMERGVTANENLKNKLHDLLVQTHEEVGFGP